MKLKDILNLMNGKQVFELREVYNGNFVGSEKLVEITLNACNYCTLQNIRKEPYLASTQSAAPLQSILQMNKEKMVILAKSKDNHFL